MIPRPLAPSALLKNLSALARGSLWLLLGAWLLFLLAWGTLHWVIVPRIGEFRPMLEAQGTRLLGIELRDAPLFDGQDRSALGSALRPVYALALAATSCINSVRPVIKVDTGRPECVAIATELVRSGSTIRRNS